MSDSMLRLRPDVRIEPRYAGYDVDCRLLFMGDRYRQLLRAYPEVIRRLTRRSSLPLVAQDLRDSPEILHYYQVCEHNDRVGVVMRDEFFRNPAPLDDVRFELLVWDPAHHRRYPLPLERFRALGRLLPLLGGDRTGAHVADQLRAELSGPALAWAEELLASLSSDGFVEQVAAAAPNAFLQSVARPRVSLVAHTSLMLQSARATVILDPLLRTGNSVHQRIRDIMRLKLDAICLSHSHWDHCDVASLLLLDKRTPVVIPELRCPTVFNPPIASMLRLIGFEDVREAPYWEPVRVGDVDIIPVPFHGEQDEPHAEIDHYTYVLKTDGLCLYGGVDAFQDTDGDMRADLERVRVEHRPTVAFLPVSRMTYAYANGGVNGFCRAVDTDTVTREFQYTAGPELAVDWVRTLDPKLVAPYATFAFERNMADPEIWGFATAMEQAGMADRLMLLRPLDAVEPDDLRDRPSAIRRRKFLRRWAWLAAARTRVDRSYGRRFPYRLVKRFWNVSRPPEEIPPGWVNS
jgi:L-ascorbate metabolism protein UlaG (beta-lactamase superfamily)